MRIVSLGYPRAFGSWEPSASPASRGAKRQRRGAEWREALQRQRMTASLEKIAKRKPCAVALVDELEGLLDEGAITKEGYEKVKKKLLNQTGGRCEEKDHACFPLYYARTILLDCRVLCVGQWGL